jgi:hypothetical protein
MKLCRFTGRDIKVFDMHKYDCLQLSDEFRYLASSEEGQAMIIDCCNGVGSSGGFWGWTYHLIPNDALWLDITADSDPHDTDYTYPKHFKNMADALAHKDAADKRLYDNLRITIKAKSNFIMYPLRIPYAHILYMFVHLNGLSAFLQGKTFDDGTIVSQSKLNLNAVLK